MRIKICCIISVIMLSLYFSSCKLADSGPDKVTINGTVYVTGFYEKLYPDEFTLSKETYMADETEFRELEHDLFSMMHADIGPYTAGTVYCKENQLSEAEAYYADPDNYNYYCRVGVYTKDSDPDFYDITGQIDPDKFKELRKYAIESSYDPFNIFKVGNAEKIEIDAPDEEDAPTIIFYKNSKDGLFTSGTAEEFRLIDCELVLLHYYDMGNGEYYKMLWVKVPKELNHYFTNFLDEYVFPCNPME